LLVLLQLSSSSILMFSHHFFLSGDWSNYLLNQMSVRCLGRWPFSLNPAG
jgi:hypothetical protein